MAGSSGNIWFPLYKAAKTRTHTYGKFQNTDAAFFCYNKMSEFMDEIRSIQKQELLKKYS